MNTAYHILIRVQDPDVFFEIFVMVVHLVIKMYQLLPKS
jgi:hypothetical protein